MIHILTLSGLYPDADTRQPQDLPQMHQHVAQMVSQDQDMPLLGDQTEGQPVFPIPADAVLSTPLVEMEATVGECPFFIDFFSVFDNNS